MKYKKIPNTDLNVSVISLGTWVFSGDVWGRVSEKECIDAVSAAIECGINLIDTAPIYGYGKAEEIVGEAINGKRDKVIIATKCGLIKKGLGITNNLKPDSIRKELDESLKRLKTDYIDICQCHWPDSDTPIEETLAEMTRLKNEGKIKYIGLSNYDIGLLKQATSLADITTLQSHYSLLERSIEKEILPYCIEKNIGILTYGSLGGGILSGKYQTQPSFNSSDARSFFYKFYKGDEFKKASKIVNVLKDISEKTKRPMSQIALNWIWQKEGIITAIAGCRNAQQAKLNALSTEWELSDEYINILIQTK